MITITNDQLKASINLKGAELSSLIHQKSGTEYIWQADPSYWARRAPILFPIVGKLKNNEYKLDNLTYSMSQHGFARDSDFQMIWHEENYASFSLKNSVHTRMQYPFRFELIVHYELQDSSLIVTYQVINRNPKTMYFSIGGHPAFNCPIDKGKRSDYQLVFNKPETASTQLLENGLRNGSTQPVLQEESVIPISDSLFDQDALIFENLNSTSVSLQKGPKKILTFHFDGFPYLGIWSKNRESPFVCIEPWYGIADKDASLQDITQKEGILTLNSSESFECKYSIEIH